MRILLVEDDRQLRRFMTIALEGMGYEVIGFPDADLLFESARWTNIDALLLDLVLKRGTRSALDLLIWLATTRLTVLKIVITGWDVLREFDDVTVPLVDFVLSKPVDLDRLDKILKTGEDDGEEAAE